MTKNITYLELMKMLEKGEKAKKIRIGNHWYEIKKIKDEEKHN